MSARTTLAALAAALALGAAGCGDSDTTATTASATDDPSVARSAGEGVLALGRGAVAPFVDYGTPDQAKKTKVGVRVHEVRKGKIADFKGFNLEPDQRRSTCAPRWRTATAASTARPRSSCSAAASRSAPSPPARR